MNTAELVVRCLESEGVRWVFAVPGEENLDLLEAIRRSNPLELIVVRHEQAAGFMAATVGRLTGQPGVVLATLGPGATNLITAAAFATLGGMPALFLTGQKPLRESKQGAFQILDVVAMMDPVVRWTRQVVGSAWVPARFREAFRVAASEPPGAVHLELPEDVLRDPAEGRPLPAPALHLPRPSADSVEAAASLLRRARRPLLVFGAGAQRIETCDALRRFVDELGIPFMSTQMGKGVLREDHPGYVGTAALSEGDFVHRAVEAADVILNVGHRVVEKPPFRMHRDDEWNEEGGCRTKARVIHLDHLPATVDPVYAPHVEVIGDPAHAIDGLRALLGSKGGPRWDLRTLGPLREAADRHREAAASSDAFPLRSERIVADLREVLPAESHVALDNGMYKLWFTRNYPALGRNTLLVDNALATMGAGLPSAMAARMVHPDRPVVCVTGDGGLLMNGQEMETAVRLGLDLVVVVLRDDGYGMIRWKQEEMGLPDFGLSFGNPDFVAWAEAYGARGLRVHSAADFVPALPEALDGGGVCLLDVPVTYAGDHRLLNEEIPRLAAAVSLS